jgi:16S rRNA (cytosine967-C5)-methyltransferase
MDAFIQVMEYKRRPEDATKELYEKHRGMKSVDKAFAKEALFGSLRWYAKIYWILQNTSKRDLDKSPPEVRAALVIGTYQIFYMSKVPDRAAVNESVEYVRKRGHANAVPFANGILRQIARKAEYFAKPDKNTNPVEYLSLQFSHPEWMVRRWATTHKFVKLEEMLSSNNKPPPIFIRVNSMKMPIETAHELQTNFLRDEKIHSDREPLRGCLTLQAFPSVEPDSFFAKGLFTFQDESSQLIGHLVDPQRGEFIIDTCCGPGGKLSHVYELGQGKIELLGVEKDPEQMRKAKETMARLGHGPITWAEADFFSFQPEKAPDKILLDAPCSGLGVLRRHPEGKWQKSASLVQKMADQQKQLIENSIKMLKVGGNLIYSVCSFENEETVDQLQWALKTFGDQIEVVSPISRLPDFFKRYVTRENVLLIYSGNQNDADGFGAFIIRKLK